MAERAAALKASANKAIAQKKLGQALTELNEAIELAPDDVALWSNRAYVHELQKEHAAALADAQECIRRSPNFAKGYLRAGRALLALNRQEEAVTMLLGASERFPQDYALQEALNDAHQATPNAVAASEASSMQTAPSAVSESKGLSSSYYYAAVPASERKLPMQQPARIADEAGRAGPASAGLAASGAIKQDLEQKGSDSYYYAHDRAKDYHVPTVPKKIDADGKLRDYKM